MSGYYVGRYVPMRGPLASQAEGFADGMWGRGYSARTVDAQMRMLRDMSGWLEDQGIALAVLDDEVVESYVSQRRLRTKTLRSARAVAPLLGFLRDEGVVPPPSSKVAAEAPAVAVVAFEEYLREVGAVGGPGGELLLPGQPAHVVGGARGVGVTNRRTGEALHRLACGCPKTKVGAGAHQRGPSAGRRRPGVRPTRSRRQLSHPRLASRRHQGIRHVAEGIGPAAAEAIPRA